MKRQYDVVIVDALGDECLLSYIFMKNSDCIINVLTQDIFRATFSFDCDQFLRYNKTRD